MHTSTIGVLAAGGAAAAALASPSTQKVAVYNDGVPSLAVYACPQMASVTYSQSVPDQTPFPNTEVGLCYDDAAGFLHINFTAYEEEYFFYDPAMENNDNLFFYEVMEAFIAPGTADPQFYLEYEVNPNNKTWQAFIYNPSKVRESNTPFDHFFIDDIYTDGLTAQTTLDKPAQIWNSAVQIPLGLFNVDQGEAKGTEWRMNFFRIVESEESYPNQTLGAWSPPDEANFHMTPFFGNVKFV